MKKKTISPSSLSYLMECERCFWIAHNKRMTVDGKEKWANPPGVFPSILNRIHKLIEDMIKHSDVTPQAIIGKDWVWLALENRMKTEYKGYTVSGRMDVIAQSDNGGCILDWKTSNGSRLDLYNRSMQVYGLIMEDNGKKVDETMIVCDVWPRDMGYFHIGSNVACNWDFTPHELKYDRAKAESILDTAIEIIERDTCPDPSLNCDVCQYVETVKGL